MRKLQEIFSGRHPVVMGILNVTPDSFSDGGKYASIDSALKKAGEMVDSGAEIIDIGAESTRSGAELVSEAEELARLIPAVEAVRAKFPDVALSADTYKPAVAAAAVGAGADIINDVVSDISGGYKMAKVAAKLNCGLVITHNNRGAEIKADFFEKFLDNMRKKLDSALAAGVEAKNIILDPGIGFGKTFSQNVELIARLKGLKKFGFPVLLGVSRKSMFSQIVGDDFSDRDDATAAVGAIAALNNFADILRVHDVKKTLNAVKTALTIKKIWTK